MQGSLLRKENVLAVELHISSRTNNDKISAVRIGKAYLAGTAKIVWVPDPLTQERRDWFHAHSKTVKRTTQMRNRLGSYLSDHSVRLPSNTPLTEAPAAEQILRQSHDWSERQWQVIQLMLMELRHADQQRRHWRSLIAQEVPGGWAAVVTGSAVRSARHGGLRLRGVDR